ncbi:RluA family pseudouridine synthase [Cerasicoccus frondis]|uniref:RluA family pseudouridine synthase n=1 Tax=Cerasicoccus frondis TaxID=490090 RepID=UPI0028529326|nr:RluA family pseudouridine synthase [Cerasicoccus frondis]
MSEAGDNDWLPWGKGVRLLGSHPVGLLALEKPVGVLSHPNEEHADDRERSLLVADYDHERECYHGFPNDAAPEAAYLLHRLDSATSGVILLATNQAVAEAIKLRFQSHDVEKTYFALVKGAGRPGMHGLWADLLEKNHRHGRRGPVYASQGGVTAARTAFKWERGDNFRYGLSLMRLNPHTGRTHQLRYQCAKNNMPIVGDRTYGDFRFNRKVKSVTNLRRLFLHAAKIEVRFALNGDIVRFSAQSPLPSEFEGMLGKNQDWVKGLTRQPTPGEIAERQRARIRDSLRGPQARKRGRRHHH